MKNIFKSKTSIKKDVIKEVKMCETHLKFPTPDSIIAICKSLEDAPIHKFEFGAPVFKMSKSCNAILKHKVMTLGEAITLIKSVSEISHDTKLKTVVINHTFYTIGIDDNLYKLQIITRCSGVLFDERITKLLLHSANVYADGIVRSNGIDAISKYDLLVPDIRDINLIHSRKYEGETSVYGDVNDYLKTGEITVGSDTKYDIIEEDIPETKKDESMIVKVITKQSTM